MLILLSPAKSLDFDRPAPVEKSSTPTFAKETKKLVEVMQGLTRLDIQNLMSLSDSLAELNHHRYQTFYQQPQKQALFAFTGDVYQGLDSKSLSVEEVDRAQEQVRILSGIYGLLKPLDLIWPYRLEMGTRLELETGTGLYKYWADKITKEINAGEKDFVVNLASNEYFKAVDKKTLQPKVITPKFLDEKKGEYKMISFFAKKARGLMARYLVQSCVTEPEGILKFDLQGYRYDPDLSEELTPTFTRAENWQLQL